MRPHRRAELTRPTEWGPLQQPCSGCMKKYGRSGLRLLRWPATTPPTSFRHCPALPCPALPCPALPCHLWLCWGSYACTCACACWHAAPSWIMHRPHHGVSSLATTSHADAPSWDMLAHHHVPCTSALRVQAHTPHHMLSTCTNTDVQIWLCLAGTAGRFCFVLHCIFGHITCVWHALKCTISSDQTALASSSSWHGQTACISQCSCM